MRAGRVLREWRAVTPALIEAMDLELGAEVVFRLQCAKESGGGAHSTAAILLAFVGALERIVFACWYSMYDIRFRLT
ncbi:hypothetical protein BON30_34715 [Cystobacter ferrugineus]|uniref:Uncharacterized protein n=1 Tax=Cystobacter ferrugineus TaxID=83449 RepID=A0A1L9B208_9BACT|nr:hypothetical protein BON30_34715 [Cystobacter ferrugineus]